MRIQEMRSSLSHFKKRIDTEKDKTIFQVEPIGHTIPATNPILQPVHVIHELDQKRWAVVSFKRVEARGLTYDQAVRLMEGLELENVAGLCIVTNEAAAAISQG